VQNDRLRATDPMLLFGGQGNLPLPGSREKAQRRVRAIEAVAGVLAASISGPNTPTGGLQAWTANVTNSVAPTTNVWERRDFCDTEFSPPGQTTATYTEVTTVGLSFYLRVTITSAGRTASSVKLVGGFQVC
jgi:hypothetical protein